MIDANLMIYALGRSHEYKIASATVLDRAQAGDIEANISTEVLQEVLHYFHRVGRTEAAIEAFDNLVISFPEPFTIDFAVTKRARDVLQAYPFLPTRDAFHAAVVFQHRLEGIISADRAFDRITGLTRFDPKELAA